MDPLSITCAVIAFLGAVSSTIKAARTVYNAPEELESLLNDLTDTGLMLRDVQAFLEEGHMALEDPRCRILQERLTVADTLLLELKRILDTLIDPNNSPQLRRFRWQKAKKRTLKLSKQLAVIYEDLPKRVNQMGQHHLKLELQSLSLAQSQINSTLSGVLETWPSMDRISALLPARRLQEETHASVEELRQNTSIILTRLENSLAAHEGLLTPTTAQSPSEFPSIPLAASSTDGATIPQSRYQSIMIRTRHYSPRFCNESCCCYCHAKQSYATPSLLTTVLGQLFIGYRGIPFVARPCNDSRCKRKFQPAVFATYYFPRWWVIKRIMVFTATHTATGGPEVALKFPRLISSHATVFLAAQRNDIDALKRLFRNCEASPKDVREWESSTTLLQVAINAKSLAMVKFLLQAGADPEVARDKNGRTATEGLCMKLFAGEIQHSEREWVAEQFLPRLLDYTQFPSLHETVIGLRTSTIEREVANFISSTATINDLDIFGYTALAWASCRGDLVSVEQLLEFGADSNLDTSKIYPLCESIKSGAFDCALFLLSHGADAKVLTADGATTIMLAMHITKHPLLIPLLNALFSLGVSINQKSHTNISCLRTAFQENNIPAIRWLLAHNFDYRNPWKLDNFLHSLAWSGTIETVEVIREARWSGVDIYERDVVTGGTPMDWILWKERDPPASPELIEVFMRLLAEVETRSYDGSLGQREKQKESGRKISFLATEEFIEAFRFLCKEVEEGVDLEGNQCFYDMGEDGRVDGDMEDESEHEEKDIFEDSIEFHVTQLTIK